MFRFSPRSIRRINYILGMVLASLMLAVIGGLVIRYLLHLVGGSGWLVDTLLWIVPVNRTIDPWLQENPSGLLTIMSLLLSVYALSVNLTNSRKLAYRQSEAWAVDRFCRWSAPWISATLTKLEAKRDYIAAADNKTQLKLALGEVIAIAGEIVERLGTGKASTGESRLTDARPLFHTGLFEAHLALVTAAAGYSAAFGGDFDISEETIAGLRQETRALPQKLTEFGAAFRAFEKGVWMDDPVG